jgi:porin
MPIFQVVWVSVLISPWPLFADAENLSSEVNAQSSAEQQGIPNPTIEEKPFSEQEAKKEDLFSSQPQKKIDISANLILDDGWNLSGGKHRTDGWGDYEYLFTLNLSVNSMPLLHYPGGTLFASFQSHAGKNPSKDVGSLIDVDVIQAHTLNNLYDLWYKQVFGQDRIWILAGKSDAYENFTNTAHSASFINSGYTANPTILFFPTYPNPAMSVIGSVTFARDFSLTLGVFDGSLAIGVNTLKHGVFGKFFEHLSKHAFLIQELDWIWGNSSYRKGRLGLGIWEHTAKLRKFNGGMQRGAWGPYLTLDQVIHNTDREELGGFLNVGVTSPSVSEVQSYYGIGLTWLGALVSRPSDTIGIGVSLSKLSQEKGAGLTQSYEASYEIFYQMNLASWCYMQPDFQYIVHPGGQALSNASFFTFRFFFMI